MVRAKKQFGQHFLRDADAATQIIDSLNGDADTVIEIGPGQGVLTHALHEKFGDRFHAVEIDRDLCALLRKQIPGLNLVEEDFLKLDMSSFAGSIAVIGNFPYNISSQIIFRVIDHREQVTEVVGMFQREMARRIASDEGSKEYGVISVLSGCYYQRRLLFELGEDAFVPRPKVRSAVIHLKRDAPNDPDCNEVLLKQVVKSAFNLRRKKIRNSLKSLVSDERILDHQFFELRPEQLSIDNFVELTNMLDV